MTNDIMCPICNLTMKKGGIYQDRYPLKWIPEEKDKGSVFSPLTKGIKLTSLDKSYCTGFYCENCKKIIINVEIK